MEGHKIPNKIESINKKWFDMGCISEMPPEYIKDINLEDLKKGIIKEC